MWDVPVITDRTVQANQTDTVLHDKKQICLLFDIAIQDDLNINKQRNWKTMQVQRPGDQGQQDVESEDKTCASYNWSIRNN